MVDFHSHILPGMDDGSKSEKESIDMLGEYSDRITDVFLTPHFYPDRESPNEFLKRREKSAEVLRNAIEGKNVPVLHLGAEVGYYEGIHNSEEMEKLVISGSRLLLVEMPFRDWNLRMVDELIELNRRFGIRPVMAHIDRYNFGQGPNKKAFKHFLDNRGLVQVNAEAVMSMLSRMKVVSMIRKGEIHFIGSDAHNMLMRKPNLDAAIDKLIKAKSEDVLKDLDENVNKYINR